MFLIDEKSFISYLSFLLFVFFSKYVAILSIPKESNSSRFSEDVFKEILLGLTSSNFEIIENNFYYLVYLFPLYSTINFNYRFVYVF